MISERAKLWTLDPLCKSIDIMVVRQERGVDQTVKPHRSQNRKHIGHCSEREMKKPCKTLSDGDEVTRMGNGDGTGGGKTLC